MRIWSKNYDFRKIYINFQKLLFSRNDTINTATDDSFHPFVLFGFPNKTILDRWLCQPTLRFFAHLNFCGKFQNSYKPSGTDCKTCTESFPDHKTLLKHQRFAHSFCKAPIKLWKWDSFITKITNIRRVLNFGIWGWKPNWILHLWCCLIQSSF